MNLHISAKTVVGLFVVLLLSACSEPTDTAKTDSLDRTADEAAIRSLLQTNFAASTARDAASVAATFMPDGDGWIAGLSRASTHDGLRSLEEDFGGMPGFQGYEGTIESVRFISPDAAIVEVAGLTIMDTGSFEEETTIVVARNGGGWKIAAWRVMTFDETLLNILRE